MARLVLGLVAGMACAMVLAVALMIGLGPLVDLVAPVDTAGSVENLEQAVAQRIWLHTLRLHASVALSLFLSALLAGRIAGRAEAGLALCLWAGLILAAMALFDRGVMFEKEAALSDVIGFLTALAGALAGALAARLWRKGRAARAARGQLAAF